jgi:hypothetical protein
MEPGATLKEDLVADQAPDHALLENNASGGKPEISCEYQRVLERSHKAGDQRKHGMRR